MKLLLTFVFSTSMYAGEGLWKTKLADDLCENIRVMNGSQMRSKIFKMSKRNGELFVLTDSNDGMREVLRVEDDRAEILFSVSRRVRDFVVADGHVWLMEPYDLVKVSMTGEEQARFSSIHAPSPSHYSNYRMRDIAMSGKYLFLAHSLHGLAVFDTSVNKIISIHDLADFQENLGHRSMINAATVDGDFLYLAVSRGSPKAFNGVAKFDIKNMKMVSASHYNERRMGVVGLDPFITSNKDAVLLNNGGWAHYIPKSKLTSKKITPKWLAIKSENAYSYSYGSMVGDLTMDENNFYGCLTSMLRDKDDSNYLVNRQVQKSLN